MTRFITTESPALGAVSDQPPVIFDPTLLAGSLAAGSITMYRRDAAAYLTFAQTPEVAGQPATLARWRTHLAAETGLSPNTINRMLAAVKAFTRAAAEQGYLDAATAEAFGLVRGVSTRALRDRLKPNRRVKISREQMRLLIAAPLRDEPKQHPLVALRDHALLLTMAASGMRVEEIAGLRSEQIISREGHHFIQVLGKTDVEPRDAPLSPRAEQAIRRWLAARPVGSAYVFTAFGGAVTDANPRLRDVPISPTGIWKLVRAYAALIGLENVKPHDFRRYVGTQLAKHDLRMAQKALGHKRIETTAQHYVLDELPGGTTDDLT